MFRLVFWCVLGEHVVLVGVVVVLVLRSEVIRDYVGPCGSLGAVVEFCDLVFVAPEWNAPV